VKTWLLITLESSERQYGGNLGYEDALRSVYRYDSFVPNYKQLSPGDAVLLRGKSNIFGCAVIERIDSQVSTKRRLLCPVCASTKLKQRAQETPRYRCECGETFDRPSERDDSCTTYDAHFGASFQPLDDSITIAQLWALAPRLNKQLAMLEIDTRGTAELVRAAVTRIAPTDTPPASTKSLFKEGQRTSVLVNRYERDPKARQACLEHYGCRCAACGFIFSSFYGALGEGVIEVHHLEQLSEGEGGRLVDAVRDLRPLCSNCHTMIHRRQPALTIDELRALIQRPSV
jgi:hypothetical protein